jgi:hypothetical protein
MNRHILFGLIAVLGLSLSARSQGPSDPNEGSRLSYNSAAGTFTFSWWSRAGKSYFILQTDDLLTSWNYLPEVITGTDEIRNLGFQAPLSDKLFLRLEILSYDPYTFDTDGEGMVDAYEVLNLLDHKVADGTLDRDGDGVINERDARPKDAAIGQLNISITTPANGSTVN